MARIQSQIEEEPTGSFTSMIDIVFLLLIFFLLLPFKETDYRLSAYLPKDVGGGSSAADIVPPIQFDITGSGDEVTYIINDQPVDRRYLASRLLTESANDTTVPVTINPHPNVNFRHVLTALDECAVAEMKKVTFGIQ
jgi:biopolymer transport protein ExbD